MAAQGAPQTATAMVTSTAAELRERFRTLHRRLGPLAATAPTPGRVQRSLDAVQVGPLERLPKLGTSAQRAHQAIRVLVSEIDTNIKPHIPETSTTDGAALVLSKDAVRVLAAKLAAGGNVP